MTNEIAPLPIAELTTAAAQLRVTLEVDQESLLNEIRGILDGFSTTTLAIKTIQVVDEDSYRDVIRLREDAGGREKRLTAVWKRYKDPLNAARGVVLDFEHKTVDVVKAAKDSASKKAEAYIRERNEAARRAQEQLDRAARIQEQETLREARALEQRGLIDEADQKRMEAQMCQAPSIRTAPPVVAGAKVVPTATATVMDIVAFAKAIVDGHIDLIQEVRPGDLRPILVVDQVVLNAVAARQMTGLNWPGIKVEEGVRISSTGR